MSDGERFGVWGAAVGVCQQACSSEGGAKGAADRKQQPVWVNAVIKAFISSAKRECVIDHCRRQLRERQLLMDGWLCGGWPGRPAPPRAACWARGAEPHPHSPLPRMGRGALPLPRCQGGRQESWCLRCRSYCLFSGLPVAPGKRQTHRRGKSDPSPPLVPSQVRLQTPS